LWISKIKARSLFSWCGAKKIIKKRAGKERRHPTILRDFIRPTPIIKTSDLYTPREYYFYGHGTFVD